MTQVVTLHGARMTTREAAHRELAHSLGLPAHYGRNLDALADCLTDLPGLAVLWVDYATAERSLGDYAPAMLAVFRDAGVPVTLGQP